MEFLYLVGGSLTVVGLLVFGMRWKDNRVVKDDGSTFKIEADDTDETVTDKSVTSAE